MMSCAFVTLGCKVNQYETEAIREEILALGYEEVLPEEPADLYVVNTCAVTHTSGAKSRRAVLRLARRNPSARIVVMGCQSPRERDLLRKIPQVAAVAGNDEKGMVSSLIRDGRLPGSRRDVLDLQVERFESRTRAYLKVQDGCDGCCSFCIIPFLRGRSRSRPRKAILEEVRRLAGGGYREIVVTGIHLQDYGAELSPPEALPDLLAEIAGAGRREGIRRIRLSSLGALAVTEPLVQTLRDPLFCPHLHLPLQSGDDGVLAVMRRGHGADEFRAAVGLLRGTLDLPAITTDVLVGHPGETEEAFRRTLDLCSEVGFSKIHIFPFSPREGTRSARLPGRVPAEEMERRTAAVRDLEARLALEFKRPFVGQVVEVLFEEGGEGLRSAEGYTERYLRVRAPAADPGSLRGAFRRVLVERASPEILEGNLLEPCPEMAACPLH